MGGGCVIFNMGFPKLLRAVFILVGEKREEHRGTDVGGLNRAVCKRSDHFYSNSVHGNAIARPPTCQGGRER